MHGATSKACPLSLHHRATQAAAAFKLNDMFHEAVPPLSQHCLHIGALCNSLSRSVLDHHKDVLPKLRSWRGFSLFRLRFVVFCLAGVKCKGFSFVRQRLSQQIYHRSCSMCFPLDERESRLFFFLLRLSGAVTRDLGDKHNLSHRANKPAR